jgi:hypothetical protein
MAGCAGTEAGCFQLQELLRGAQQLRKAQNGRDAEPKGCAFWFPEFVRRCLTNSTQPGRHGCRLEHIPGVFASQKTPGQKMAGCAGTEAGCFQLQELLRGAQQLRKAQNGKDVVLRPRKG